MLLFQVAFVSRWVLARSIESFSSLYSPHIRSLISRHSSIDVPVIHSLSATRARSIRSFHGCFERKEVSGEDEREIGAAASGLPATDGEKTIEREGGRRGGGKRLLSRFFSPSGRRAEDRREKAGGEREF